MRAIIDNMRNMTNFWKFTVFIHYLQKKIQKGKVRIIQRIQSTV